MPCKTVMAARVEASQVLSAYEDCSDEHVAGREKYRQLIASFMQKNPHQTVAAANAHVLSKSRTSVRSIACALDDEREAAYDSGDRTGILLTRWAGSDEAKRPYFFRARSIRLTAMCFAVQWRVRRRQKLFAWPRANSSFHRRMVSSRLLQKMASGSSVPLRR